MNFQNGRKFLTLLTFGCPTDELAVHSSRYIACRGRRIVLKLALTRNNYGNKGSLNTAVGVLLHVTVERRHL